MEQKRPFFSMRHYSEMKQQIDKKCPHHSLSTERAQFLEEMENLLQETTNLRETCSIVDDLTSDTLKRSSNNNNYLETKNRNSISQTTMSRPRFMENSSETNDLLIHKVFLHN